MIYNILLLTMDINNIITDDDMKKNFDISVEKDNNLDIIKILNNNTQLMEMIHVDKQFGYVAEISYNNKKHRIEYQYNRTIRNIEKDKITKECVFKFKIENGIHYRNASSGFGWIKKCDALGCPQNIERQSIVSFCVRHSGKINRKEINENVQNVNKSQCADVGEDTEQYVEDLLKSFDDINSIERIGRTGSTFDILYNFKGDVRRGIQVKTLTETKL